MARVVHYMDVRFEGRAHGITNAPEPDLTVVDEPALIQMTPANVFAPVGYLGLLSALLASHAADPPDAGGHLRNDLTLTYQHLRNDLVFSCQGNRNPFIDRPDRVECQYECNCASEPPVGSVADGFEPWAFSCKRGAEPLQMARPC